ncbi:uncharacterized protein LOC133187392 [Saccostrea echinata]|uniref:uncharacterized protein LOC133187392 n=1 Tax=Saccostrea echinata TaxID=191078 RepID=UPI002A7F6B82|nr:uncharacterized protein LOC133187392 [Saccostrea echinata]
MDYLPQVVTLFSSVLVDAEYCLYYTKSLAWTSFLSDENKTSLSPRYKTKSFSVYCSYGEYCCGRVCCRNQSNNNYYISTYYDENHYMTSEDDGLSTGGTFGLVFALVVAISVCALCCNVCCKQNGSGDSPFPIRHVPTIAAYSSNSGTVVIQQTPARNENLIRSTATSGIESRPEQSSPSTRRMCSHTNSPSYEIQTSRIPIDSNDYAQCLDFTAPPPSYDDVISQNYPILSESETWKTESVDINSHR